MYQNIVLSKETRFEYACFSAIKEYNEKRKGVDGAPVLFRSAGITPKPWKETTCRPGRDPGSRFRLVDRE